MKTIENRQTTILSGIPGEEPKPLSYFDLIKLIINQPSQEGFNIEQIRQRLVIWGIVDTAAETKSAEMEIKDFNLLKESVNRFKWAQIHKDIVEFVDYINSL